MASDYLFSQDIHGGPRGIINSVNNCYMNTLIQCLLCCGQFKNFFISGAYKKFINYNAMTCGMMSNAMGEIFENLLTPNSKPHHPGDFLAAVRANWSVYEEGKHMDIQEFLDFLLDSLHEEMGVTSEIKTSSNETLHDAVIAWQRVKVSPVSHLFMMQIVTQLRCSHCNYLRRTHDDTSTVLSVALLSNKCKNLENCFDEFFGEEPLPSMKCPSCLNPTISHRLILGRLPQIIIVHLKRFEHNKMTNLSTKLRKELEYSMEVDLKNYCIPGLQSNTQYRLVGVANHHGNLHDGHYIALSQQGHRWYKINDTQVSSITTRNLCTSAGYVLFYERQPQAAGDLPFDISSTKAVEEVLQSASDSVPKDCDQNNNDWNSEPIVDEDRNINDYEEDFCYNDTDNGTDNAQPDLEFPLESVSIPNLEPLTLNSDNEVSTDATVDNAVILVEQEAVKPVPTKNGNAQLPACQHPSLDLDLIDPVLNEDDVPGAKLDLTNLTTYRRDHLIRWLACRGLRTKGNKAELVQRILNHQKSSHKIFPGVDKGKWYEEKRRRVIDEAHDHILRFPIMPVGKKFWKPFPSVHIPNQYSADKAIDYLKRIPQLRFSYEGAVAPKNVIAESNEEDEDEEGLYDADVPTQQDRKLLFLDGTIKRSNLFIDSGRVLSIEDCERDGHYFMKAQVQASMNKRAYGINVMIAQTSGDVCLADCSCKARALGRCCHVMAVLLLIGRHVEMQGHAAVTCTDRSCYWLAPSTSLAKRPGIIKEKPGYYSKFNFNRRAQFDPRPTSHQTDQDDERLKILGDIVSTMPSKILWYYQLQRELLQQPPGHLDNEDDEFPDIEFTQAIAEMCSYLIWNLNLIRHYSSSAPLHFPLTKQQTSSLHWWSERRVRVPASSCKTALGLLSPRSTADGKMNFLRKHVWGLDPFRNQDMEYGSNLEANAREAFVKDLDPEYDLIQTGIWVNPKYPYLSCSPDGIIVDVNGFVKLLEIKCPAVLMHMDPNDFEQLPPNQLKNFCLKRSQETGLIELRKTNKWYYQVQQSLDILNLDICVFLVYSEIKSKPKYIKIEVPYDETFWREKRERLAHVHRSLIVPEVFLYRTVFKRHIHPLLYSEFHEDHEDEYFYFGSYPDLVLSVENESEVLINYCD